MSVLSSGTAPARRASLACGCVCADMQARTCTREGVRVQQERDRAQLLLSDCSSRERELQLQAACNFHFNPPLSPFPALVLIPWTRLHALPRAGASGQRADGQRAAALADPDPLTSVPAPVWTHSPHRRRLSRLTHSGACSSPL
eukprot:357817-Chlamydomonas_euryale.AAC.2